MRAREFEAHVRTSAASPLSGSEIAWAYIAFAEAMVSIALSPHATDQELEEAAFCREQMALPGCRSALLGALRARP